MQRRRSARARPAGGAPIAGCSAMLYGPSNAASSDAAMFAHDPGRADHPRLARADDGHEHADVADGSAVDAGHPAQRCEGRAPNQTPRTSRMTSDARRSHQRHRRRDCSGVEAARCARVAPRVRTTPSTKSNSVTRRPYNAGDEPRRASHDPPSGRRGASGPPRRRLHRLVIRLVERGLLTNRDVRDHPNARITTGRRARLNAATTPTSPATSSLKYRHRSTARWRAPNHYAAPARMTLSARRSYQPHRRCDFSRVEAAGCARAAPGVRITPSTESHSVKRRPYNVAAHPRHARVTIPSSARGTRERAPVPPGAAACYAATSTVA